MSKHTSGPWGTCAADGWRVDRDSVGTVETHAVCDANGKIVAFAVDYSDEIFAPLNTDHVSLIAAAPDLLEALQSVVEFWDKLNFDGSAINNLHVAARAAIAKATGGAA